MNEEGKGQKVNLDKPLLDLSGLPVEELQGDGKTKKPVVLKRIVADALLSVTDSQRNSDGESKAEMFALAMKIINSNGNLTLTSQEGAKIREHIGIVCSPIVVGRVYEEIK